MQQYQLQVLPIQKCHTSDHCSFSSLNPGMQEQTDIERLSKILSTLKLSSMKRADFFGISIIQTNITITTEKVNKVYKGQKDKQNHQNSMKRNFHIKFLIFLNKDKVSNFVAIEGTATESALRKTSCSTLQNEREEIDSKKEIMIYKRN